MQKIDSKATFVTPPSHWPIVGCLALFSIAVGAVNWLHGNDIGHYVFGCGLAILLFMMYGWFSQVIQESQAGLNVHAQVNRSFRWGMAWFIFSEVMFFGVFFGVLLYARVWTIPYLGGHEGGLMTHYLLWPHFKASWPLLQTPDPSQYAPPKGVIEAWHIPALNTLILLLSGVTITIAHWAIIKSKRAVALTGQAATILLGILFLFFQAHEYGEAYTQMALRLDSGIYGNTFFMLTGFHGLHVTLGTCMLMVILYRLWRGHFGKKTHFAFEAVSWYWHFVDVVWLLLFIFVYWL